VVDRGEREHTRTIRSECNLDVFLTAEHPILEHTAERLCLASWPPSPRSWQSELIVVAKRILTIRSERKVHVFLTAESRLGAGRGGHTHINHPF